MVNTRFVQKSPFADDGMASISPADDGMVGPGGCPECVDDGMKSKGADAAVLETTLAPRQCNLEPAGDGMASDGSCPECADDGMSPPK